MTTLITSTTLTSGYQLTADSTGTLTIQTGSGPTTAMYINSSQNVGIGSDNSAAGPNLWPSAVLHSRAQAITAAAPNLGWPYYISPESDANAKLVAIFDTGGNGAVQTAGYGATAVVRIGSYYDSRALITPTGSGGGGPSDQSTGSGKDLMVKGGQSDNTNGKPGGRLFLNGGSGYFGGAYGATGYYGDVIIQGHGTGNVGINTTVMNVYDAVAVNRPLVVARSDTSTSSIGSAASITISNLDTTTNNVSQINFAAITGANANHFSSAIISAIHGARTNGQYPTGTLTFSTSTSLNAAPSEKVRIASSGQVFIGDVSAIWDERLSVRLGTTTNPGLGIYSSSAAYGTGTFSNSGNAMVMLQTETAAGAGWRFLTGRAAGGALQIQILGNGSVQNALNSYGSSSDIKLKENITDASSKLLDLLKVRIVNYNLKDDLNKTKQIGVIAQELELIFPGMIDHDPVADVKGVKYSVFVPMLIKSMQEQHDLIQSLTDRITALENK